MPGFAGVDSVIGTQALPDFFIPDTTARMVLGSRMNMTDPYWGSCEFVYGKAAAAYAPGILVTPDNTFTFTAVPNTANLGRPVFAARGNFAINTYGWWQDSGLAPLAATASVAAGTAIGLTGAGTVGANTAGKQILNAVVTLAGTGTLTKTCVTNSGTKILQVPNIDGLFIGLAVSGTGVAASSTITAIDTSGNFVTLNNNMTASATVTITFTYTNFLQVYMNRPFAQGAIT